MGPITSAKDAIEAAQEFIDPYYPWHKPVKAVLENDTRVVQFDVGAVKVEIATVKIDAGSGEIMEITKAMAAAQPNLILGQFA